MGQSLIARSYTYIYLRSHSLLLLAADQVDGCTKPVNGKYVLFASPAPALVAALPARDWQTDPRAVAIYYFHKQQAFRGELPIATKAGE